MALAQLAVRIYLFFDRNQTAQALSKLSAVLFLPSENGGCGSEISIDNFFVRYIFTISEYCEITK